MAIGAYIKLELAYFSQTIVFCFLCSVFIYPILYNSTAAEVCGLYIHSLQARWKLLA